MKTPEDEFEPVPIPGWIGALVAAIVIAGLLTIGLVQLVEALT